MAFKYFSKNGEVLPIEQATVPISSIEYAYGFGVYESIRVSKGVTYFLKEHLERLMESAKIIDLEHDYEVEMIEKSIFELIAKNEIDTCNIKMLLVGATKRENAQLFIMCLNPLFPDKKLYREGAKVITYHYERSYPLAKTLNMFQSYMAYRKAKELGAYDALFVNRSGLIIEGTRTNLFFIRGQVIYTAPEGDILLGVTRMALLKVAQDNGYTVEERNFRLEDVKKYDGAFLSSTSAKIVPIRQIDDIDLPERPEALTNLMSLFSDFMAKCEGKL